MTKEAPRGDEADVPTQQARAQAPARVPRADGDGGRPQGAGAPPGEGPGEALGLVTGVSRLKRRAQFLYVQKGFKARRAAVIVEARLRAQTGPGAGAGFTATKRIGNSVIRNRARRRLREAVRQLLPGLAVAGADYVFVARPATPDAPWAALLDDVRAALLKLRADLTAPAAAPAAPSTSPKESD